VAAPILVKTDAGLYCPAGGFHIDPTRAVERAVITHAHADHARKGHRRYIATPETIAIMRKRIGRTIPTRSVEYRESFSLSSESKLSKVAVTSDAVDISFHSAGHVLGSAQVRIAYQGSVWVHTGDFKVDNDPSCAAFESVPCDTFVTESTFALPIFDWPDPLVVVSDIIDWWLNNRERGVVSIIQAYSLGKAQRLLAMIRDNLTGENGAQTYRECRDGLLSDIHVYRTIAAINRIYGKYDVDLSFAKELSSPRLSPKMAGKLILAPPQAIGQMLEGFRGRVSVAAASGWMAIPRMRKMRHVNKAFILSDHADWKGLVYALRAASPTHVMPIHGYTDAYTDWLGAQGYKTP